MTLPSRWQPAALWFGPLFGSLGFVALGTGLAADDTLLPVGLAMLGLGFVGFIASVVLMWVWLLRGARALQDATLAWSKGDVTRADERCVAALRTVFRADYRTKALHTLGLSAEARGEFEAAADLFARALPAIPMAAAPVRKRRTRILIRAHRGFCLLAAGRREEATPDLNEASKELTQGDTKGLLDALTDDASWGLGAISVNSVLMGLESGRDPRAPLTLGWALLFLTGGAPRDAIDLLNREQPTLTGALYPREQRLGARMEAAARAALGEGPHRSPAAADASTPDDRWADLVLGGANVAG